MSNRIRKNDIEHIKKQEKQRIDNKIIKNDIEHIIKQHQQIFDNKIKKLNQSQNNQPSKKEPIEESTDGLGLWNYFDIFGINKKHQKLVEEPE